MFFRKVGITYLHYLHPVKLYIEYFVKNLISICFKPLQLDPIQRQGVLEGIPKHIYMCCKDKKTVPSYVVSAWQVLNPHYKVHLYDDNECVDFLLSAYSLKHAEVFRAISDGPIKADFWRLCVLNHYGGVYTDIDIKPLVPIDSFLDPHCSFMTTLRKYEFLLNPHFIASVRNEEILSQSITKYISYHDTKTAYTYWSWSIIFIMQPIFNKICGFIVREGTYAIHGKMYQLITEDLSVFNLVFNRYAAFNSYRQKPVLKTRYDSYSESLHAFKPERI